MATEAAEVRDRLKAAYTRAEDRAAAAEAAATNASPVATGSLAATTAMEGDMGSGIIDVHAVGAVVAARRAAAAGAAGAAMDAERARGQLERSSNALDLACYLRDAALSFLQE